MPKARYTLKAGDDFVKLEMVDGKPVLVFEWECDDSDVEDADSSGNYQSDCLWEIMDHTFEAFEDNGTRIEYDYDTGKKVKALTSRKKR